MQSLKVNGTIFHVDIDGSMPLLWVLRDELALTGTKYGCGVGLCGTCAVLIDGNVVRSCSLPVDQVSGPITTIEGVVGEGSPHPVVAAWVKNQVAQCGYCQSGQIMTAIGLLQRNPAPSDEDIARALADNLCRCGTYLRIRKAIRDAATTLAQQGQ